MNYPTDLKYSKTHEWVKEDDGLTVVGISDFAQDSLGDIVFIGLPSVGDTVTMGEALGDVESVKAVSDIVCPVTGVVAEVNDDLADAPENLNSDPYGSWIIKVKDVEATEELLDAAALLTTSSVRWVFLRCPSSATTARSFSAWSITTCRT